MNDEMEWVPEDIKAAVLAIGRVEWGATPEKSDSEHVAQFAETLKITRDHFSMQGDQRMQGVYVEGTGTVVAHTGTSPNSANHARVLVGLWNNLHAALIASQEPSHV